MKNNSLCQLYHQNPSDFIYLNMWLLKDSKFSQKICQIKKTAYVRNPHQIDLTAPDVILVGDWTLGSHYEGAVMKLPTLFHLLFSRETYCNYCLSFI